MVSKILCVAEKPAIAKSVANHLAGGNVNVVRLLALAVKVGGMLMYNVEKRSW